jgi:energy-coupling factor transport system permease protein
LETALGIRFYADGIEFGLTTSSRLASLSTTLMLLFLSTPVRELLSFLQQVALPSSFIVIVFLALHFIGQLPHRMAQIFTAQEARGAAVRGTLFARIKAFFWILSPLVLSSIVETVDRGTALELRGFRGHLSPQSLAASPRSPRIISIIFLCATGVLLVWSILR